MFPEQSDDVGKTRLQRQAYLSFTTSVKTRADRLCMSENERDGASLPRKAILGQLWEMARAVVEM